MSLAGLPPVPAFQILSIEARFIHRYLAPVGLSIPIKSSHSLNLSSTEPVLSLVCLTRRWASDGGNGLPRLPPQGSARGLGRQGTPGKIYCFDQGTPTTTLRHVLLMGDSRTVNANSKAHIRDCRNICWSVGRGVHCGAQMAAEMLLRSGMKGQRLPRRKIGWLRP